MNKKVAIRCSCKELNAEIEYTPVQGQEAEAQALVDQYLDTILLHHVGTGHKIQITLSPAEPHETRRPR